MRASCCSPSSSPHHPRSHLREQDGRCPSCPGQTAPLQAGEQDGSCVTAGGEEAVGGRRGIFPCQTQNSLGLVYIWLFPGVSSPALTQPGSAHPCWPPPPLASLPAPPMGNKQHVPNPVTGNPCYRAEKHLAASLLRDKATKGKKKKKMEKAQKKAIWDASTPRFSEAFLASSFELKETAVRTLAAGETGGGSQHPHIFIALFLKPP